MNQISESDQFADAHGQPRSIHGQGCGRNVVGIDVADDGETVEVRDIRGRETTCRASGRSDIGDAATHEELATSRRQIERPASGHVSRGKIHGAQTVSAVEREQRRPFESDAGEIAATQVQLLDFLAGEHIERADAGTDGGVGDPLEDFHLPGRDVERLPQHRFRWIADIDEVQSPRIGRHHRDVPPRIQRHIRRIPSEVQLTPHRRLQELRHIDDRQTERSGGEIGRLLLGVRCRTGEDNCFGFSLKLSARNHACCNGTTTEWVEAL